MKRTFTKHVFMRASVMLLMTMLTSLGAWAGTLTHFPIYEGDEGTEAKPYQIKSATDLDYLAEDVNNGTTYEDCYFKVTAPITYTSSDAWNLESSEANNFTAIGNWNKPFKGIFDGNHQTISGIRIYKDNNNVATDDCLGLFGWIEGNAVVKDVILEDARITGLECVAGIVGFMKENATVSGCIAGNNVAIHTKADLQAGMYSHGGIVGDCDNGTISGCFSAATLTIASYYATSYDYHGTIAGHCGGTLSNNYYSGSVNGVFTGVGIGSDNTSGSDVETDNGALPVGTISLTNSSATSITSSATLTYAGTNYYLVGAEICITITVPDGNMLKELSVVDVSSNAVTVTGGWYTNNAATFTMPAGNATVAEPVFTTDFTSLYINMPKTGTVNATIPTGVTTFKIYDDGGSTGTYSKDCDGTLVLTTAIANDGFQLSGHIQAGSPPTIGAYLTVYDGNDNTATKLIDGAWGNPGKDLPTVVSNGPNMTIYFQSNHSGGVLEGFNLTATLVDITTKFDVNVASVTGGVITPSQAKAIFNQPVTLTATPESGKILYGVSIKDGNNNDVAVTQETFSNTATFTMPSSAVTVTPTFIDATAEGGLYVNMPKTGTNTVTIPTVVQSFKVYDDGGAGGTGWSRYDAEGGNYSLNCNGTLVLTAPEGYALKLSGSVTTYYTGDYLNVYDNSAASGSKLLDNVHSSSDNEVTRTTDITTVLSSGRSMTLCFTTDGIANCDGLDLTVTLVSTSTAYNVTVGTATGGTMEASPTSATVNQTVTLTAVPDAGNVLNDIQVTDEYGTINVNWDTFSNTATFKMRDKNVTVTPTFAEATADGGLYVNMPTTGTKTVTIPSGVQSFKVYDDGGSTGNYSDNCNGTLVLTAPAGYVLQLSGSITLYGSSDYLTVYDSDHADNDKKLLDKVYSSVTTAITTVTSTVNTMTIYFYSDTSRNRDGLDLTVTLKHTVELADNADNTTVIDDNDGLISTVTLQGRTLYKDGDWNTLCLPFAVTDFTGTPLEGATVKELLTTSKLDNTGKLTLNFSDDLTAIDAGKPYIVKWNKAADYETDPTVYDIVNPVFSDVTIVKTAPIGVTSTDDNVTFVGQYNPFTIDDSNIKSVILLGSNNKLGYSTGNRTLRCFRAHFFVPTTATARSFELNFGEDGGTTGVFQIENGELKVKTLNSGWYTLGGLKLQGEPTEKGVYIYNGKKVVLK